MTQHIDKHSDEIVRYYDVDWSENKFPQELRRLIDWKELGSDNLLKLKELVENEILKSLRR